MKKILLSMVFVLSFGFVFADTSSSTGTTNVNYTNIDTAKSTLITRLESVNSSLVSSVNTLSGSYQYNTGYLILQSMGKLDLSSINSNLLSTYFSLKTNIVADYNTLVSSKSILDEKKKYGLLSDTEYQQQLTTINADMASYYSKYDSLISDFNNTYLGTSGSLAAFSGNLATLLSQNASVITDASAKFAKVALVISGYNQFNTNVQKVKDLYDVNYDNFFAYVKDVKSITTQNLVTSLKTVTDSYYTKYSNLNYYSGDINNYIGKLFEGFSLDIDTYLNSLIKDFYTQDDYNFVTTNYASFKQKYLTGDKISYASLIDANFDDSDTALNTRLNTINTQISAKFTALGNPTDLKSAGDSLSQKIKDYYADKKESKISELTGFLEKQNDLLSYKLSQELDSYSVIKTRLTQLATLSGDEKIAGMKSSLTSLQTFQDGVIDKSLKADVIKTNAQLQIDLIDATIASRNYGTVVSKYPMIDSQLKKIMDALYTDAVSKNKLDSLNSKIDSALIKIDTMISSNKLSTSQEYLIYKIKKAFLRFKYIR